MIPCREGCPQYEEGCHKTCQKWKDMQEKLKIEKKRKNPIWNITIKFAQP